MSIRRLLNQYKNVDADSKFDLCEHISESLTNKLASIEKNWQGVKVGELKALAGGIARNPTYLNEVLPSENMELLQRSNLEIAIKRRDSAHCLGIYHNGIQCEGIRMSNKWCVKNPIVEKRKYQRWANFYEHQNYKKHHWQSRHKDASKWNRDVPREEISREAIFSGTGKFVNAKRIDFVYECDSEIGTLQDRKTKTRCVRVEVVRDELKNKEHRSSFHGFPISRSEYRNFLPK